MGDYMKTYKVLDLDYMGRGICKIDNKIGFVENSLLDEEVEIQVVKDNAKFFVGKSTNIYNANKNRRTFNCKFYNECGGCDIAHMNYEYQLEFKKEKIIKDLKNIAKLESVNVENVIKSEELYYRNKISLKVDKDKIGFYKKNSNDIVDIDNCIISNSNINNILYKLKSFVKKYKNNNIDEIVIKSDVETMVSIYSSNFVLIDEIIKHLNTDCILLNDTKIYNKDTITFEILDKKFIVSSNSFFQINKIQTENLYKKIIEFSDLKKSDTVLDLYCGVGTIAIFLSEYCKKVIGIEVVESAIENAKKNMTLNNLKNIEFINSKVENIIDKIEDKVKLIILDPPRTGCDKKTLKSILNIHPNKIIYVSCNPSTLSRDLFELKNFYNIEVIIPFDMFPNTHHVECLVYMSNKEAL